MALTGKVEPQFGWQNQAEHLALTHTPMGVAAMTLANKARGPAFPRTELPYPSADQGLDIKPSFLHSHPANELTMASAREMQTQLARQKLVARQMRECIEALSQRAEDAEKRYDDLEDELNVAREEILLQQNDKHSLQTSLDLLMSENARLTGRLAESNAEIEQARDQIERERAALDAANRAHNSLSVAVGEANGKQRTADNKLDAVKLECQKLTAALNALHRKHQIEVNNLKAVKIERNKLFTALDKANQKNQAYHQKLKDLQAERDRLAAALEKTDDRHRTEIEELKSSLEATTSRAVIAENLVEKVREVLLEKFSLLQASVETRNCELHDLERSRMRLIDGTKMLLEIFAMRDVALARADARARFLTDRIAELEAKSYRSRAWPGLEVNGMHSGFLERNLASDAATDRAAANSDDDVIDESRAAESSPLYPASTMLASTITF
jgi:chromosome segregation ATPase